MADQEPLPQSRAAERLSVGIFLPQEEGPGDPPPSWSHISGAAQIAEEVGFDSVWLVDHFLWPDDPWARDPAAFGVDPDPDGYGSLEAWTTISALAAVTSRVDLGTVVTCSRYRNPALLAKMADNVHGISGGRLILGLGSGDSFAEHEMFGYPIERPVSHFEEALSIIRPLLRDGRVNFSGQFYRAAAVLKPRPAGLASPPIMIGALRNRPRMLALVARFADIWNGWFWATSAEDIPPAREAVDAACLAAGREPRTLARSMVVVVALGGPMTRMDGVLSGTDEEIASALSSFRREGFDTLQLRLFPNDYVTIRRFGTILERVRALT
jgi:alkanesulfonate monooxygenase SsuD/methylene tetrahydromethanopterin reductase-like flavin-dependent oxidoreductase (luciferase family)